MLLPGWKFIGRALFLTAAVWAAALAPAWAATPASAPATAPALRSASAPATAPACPTTLPSARAGQAAEAAYRGMVNDLCCPAMAGRANGTPGVDLARDYVLAHFRSLNLRPGVGGDPQTRKSAFGDPSVSYTQTFKVRVSSQLRDHRLEMRSPGQEKPQALLAKDYTVPGFSGSGVFTGTAEFVGYSLVNARSGYDSFKDLDLKGKVAVAYRYEPLDEQGKSLWGGQPWSAAASLNEKVRQAARRGAVAILVVNPPAHSQAPMYTPSMVMGSGEGIPIFQASQSLMRQLLRQAGHEDADELAVKLQRQADKGEAAGDVFGNLVISGMVDIKPVLVDAQNVVAVLPGRGALARQAIVVGAHYDHIGNGDFASRSGPGKVHPGADDNASGTAGVMMLAKWFADRDADAPARQPAGHGTPLAGQARRGLTAAVPGGDAVASPTDRRTIYFVGFSGEERGLVGSQYMVTHLDQLGLSAGRITAMINLDMIGNLRKNWLEVYGTGTAEGLPEMVAGAVAQSGLSLKEYSSGYSPADNASFYRAKIPALMLHTGLSDRSNDYYHTFRDTPDHINSAGAVAVLSVADRLLCELGTQGESLAYAAPGGDDSAPGGNGGRLGVIYAPATEGDGCEVIKVLAGTPAEKAGLKAGDIITAWNDNELVGADSLRSAIHDAPAGEKVTLSVRRGQQSLQFQVVLSKP